MEIARQSETHRGARATSRLRGLVLDDFLSTTEQIRKGFRLRDATFGLKKMEQFPGAQEAFQTLTKATLNRHGSKIYSRPNQLISGVSDDAYKEIIGEDTYARLEITTAIAEQALRKVLEIALQTLAQLPHRDPKMGDSSRKLKALALRLVKLADDAKDVLGSRESYNRTKAYFKESGEAGHEQIFRLADDMLRVGGVLNAIVARTRVVKPKIDSPNPQVRFALYVVGWLEACTGRQQYELLKVLAMAAFWAAGREAPKWIERLAIEMHGKRRRRQNWARGLPSRRSA